MPLPLPPPDIIELGEYLATHILLEIEAGQYSREDLHDSPEIGCLEQVAAEAKRRHVDAQVSAHLIPVGRGAKLAAAAWEHQHDARFDHRSQQGHWA